MTEGNKLTRRGLTLAVSLLALATAMPTAAAETSQPSTSSMLEEMVATGIISQQQADKILNGARARDAAKAASGESAPLPDGTKRVTYVPETVKQQISQDVQNKVMAQAKAENWAAPNTHPEWTERIRLKGDIRGRYEGDYYPSGNIPGMINFNAMNSSGPVKVFGPGSTNAGVPYLDNYSTYDVDQNRERFRLRARLGVEADLGDDFTTGMRIATGDGNSPVSTNQSLGGSGGNFSKYQIWLDRAFIHWDAVKDRDMALGITAGRFDNPFFGTDLVWDDDLGFDGIAASGRYEVATGVTPFVTIGAFPVYNTDLNFSSNQDSKQVSKDKWLLGLQGGTDWKPTKDTGVKIGAAYYYYKDINGKLSSPCDITDPDGSGTTSSKVSCDTDLSRPSFAQKGNTYMALRDLSATPYNGVTVPVNAPAYQYYGLATGFHELTLTGRLDYDGFEPIRVTVDGEYVKNLAFNKNKIAAKALNNNETGSFEGGDTGYLMRLTVGKPKLAERWDWSVNLAYKYLESDAVVDGLTDSDFGMGGTNLKGTILGGSLALGKNVWTGLRWMSADSISGAPYSVDTVQADISARF
ncbi:putative porin [Magnetospirillum fulvum]|uniref:Putative porin n=1 Tax=Magnetospirillum fulvum TaxID=1082 RepID=A0A1H6HBU1_MAGFU|nr:putative porin [Magnetospirillum fulvum]SEH32936.1 Putative porin [Magnetospirillum fulvum]